MDYDLGIKQKYIEQKEAKLVMPKRDMETSEEEFNEPPPNGCLEKVLHHFMNSSLFIFPQGSYIRNLCQMCVEIEDEGEEAPKAGKGKDQITDDQSPEKS